MGKKVVPQIAQRPGAIDNTGLIYPNASKVSFHFIDLSLLFVLSAYLDLE